MSTLSGITSSLERAWASIRTVHPDVRPAAMVVYLHPAGDRRGHYGQSSWTTRDNGSLDEVHISSHILNEGPASVLETLLHEGCHSAGMTRGVQTTSRQGRYHNHYFALLAVEFGLVVAVDPTWGATTPGITEVTIEIYRNTLSDLEESLDMWQTRKLFLPGAKVKGESRQIKLVCPTCGRIIRASKKTLAIGPIRCVPCDTDFRPEN